VLSTEKQFLGHHPTKVSAYLPSISPTHRDVPFQDWIDVFSRSPNPKMSFYRCRQKHVMFQLQHTAGSVHHVIAEGQVRDTELLHPQSKKNRRIERFFFFNGNLFLVNTVPLSHWSTIHDTKFQQKACEVRYP
jgi:hypothetical protein